MAAKKKKSKIVPVRPKSSPYTSSPATVYFGVHRQQYYVQTALLSRLENIPIPEPFTVGTVFEDVDADTGHVLIHFLHTGAYQTLDKIGDETVGFDDTDITIDEFQKAVRACEAAIKYGLPVLQQLAQAEMERTGAIMNLRDAVRAISEESIAKYLNEGTWLQAFVSQKVHSAFELNPELFTERDFFERAQSHTLTMFLARDIVALYSKKVLDLQKNNQAHGNPLPFDIQGHTSYTNWTNPFGQWKTLDSLNRTTNTESVPIGTADVLEDSSAAADPHVLNDGKPSTSKEHASEMAASPSGGTEDSVKTPNMLRDSPRAEDAAGVGAPRYTSTHTLAVSAKPGDAQSASIDTSAETKQDGLGWDDWGPIATSLKKKKKKGKVPKSTWDDPTPAAAEPEPAPAPVPEPEPATEQSLPEVAQEPVLIVEPPPAEEEEDPWGAFRSSTKKKKKKSRAEAMYETTAEEPMPVPDSDLIEPPLHESAQEPVLIVDPPPAEVEEETWSETRSKTKKKKKKSKADAVYDFPAEESMPAPDPGSIEPNASGEDAMTAQATAVLATDDCPWRSEHLFEGDGWRTCKICQAHMREMASKLQAAGM